MELNEQLMFLPSLLTLPDWFKSQQQELKQQYHTMSLPTIERVKFHRWPLFQETLVDVQGAMDILTYSVQGAIDGEDAYSAQIVHAGNHTIMSSVDEALVNQGVIVMDLVDALSEYEDLVRPHLFSVIQPNHDKIAAYHTAYLNGGIFIYIPKNVVVTKPIETVLLQDSRYEQAFNKHVLIVVEENAQLALLERLKTEGASANSATIFVEVIAKNGAQIKYSAVDTLGSTTHAYIRRHATTAHNAKIDWAIGTLNDGNVILDLDTYLNGNGSEAQVQVVGISNQRQIQAVDSKVVNRGHHSIGNILQHGVILDRATLTFNGIGLIEKYAKGADAQQESRILMLSEKARGDANPILLIEEFEVTAGHAASVGQVDEEQLYYLMSRGLTRQTAEHMVTRGFLGPVIVQMPSAQVRQELVTIIDAKLQQLSNHK